MTVRVDQSASRMHRTMLDIAGVKLEVHESGEPGASAGAPILFLHGGQGPAAANPFFTAVSGSASATGSRHRVIMPTHPGFGGSSLPDWLDSCDDIAYVHLELLDRLGLARVAVVGASIGGWIAAEMATKSPERFSRVVLIGAVGVKTGSVDRLDIPDLFATPLPKLQAMLYHDPARHRIDPAGMSEDQLLAAVRARETLALLAWEPYMHNPKLLHRLQRITAPTLLLRGAHDGLVGADYTATYARLFPNARVETIAAAGHSPHVEQPDVTAAMIRNFLAA